jgi:hypothetical protein
MSSHCHIALGVIQQSKGGSAIARLAYQTCGFFDDRGRHGNYVRFAGERVGGMILLPAGAPPEFADELTFVMATGFREKRSDAQAGRTIDFSLPRELPRQFLLPVAAFALASFAADGMAVRIDIECPSASDGAANPHAHCYLSQRVLEGDGFGRKGREWNELFLRDRGRYVRAVISERLTRACALLGVAAYVDPRRNEQKGSPQPEERIPAGLWHAHDRGIYVVPIEKLKAERKKRVAAQISLSGPAKPNENVVSIRNAVSRRDPPSSEERQRRMNLVIAMALDGYAEAHATTSVQGKIVLTTLDAALEFDGETFAAEGIVTPGQAQIIVKLGNALDWAALVVEGDSKSTDEIIVAGIPVGLTTINTCASDNAIKLIHKKFRHLVYDAVAPHDPCHVVDAVLRKVIAPIETAGPRMAAPKEPTMSDPDSHSDDFDVMGPTTSQADEKRREEAGLLFETYVALQSERMLRRNLGHGIEKIPDQPNSPGLGPQKG